MFYSFETVWRAPIKRIFLLWGLVMLIGFALHAWFSAYLLWWIPLTIIGLGGQIYKQNLSLPKARILLALWSIISIVGIILTFIIYEGIALSILYPTNFGLWWLALMAVPQVITGYMLNNRFLQIVGAVWLIVAFIFRESTLPYQTVFIIVALVAGLPYLYYAFKK